MSLSLFLRKTGIRDRVSAQVLMCLFSCLLHLLVHLSKHNVKSLALSFFIDCIELVLVFHRLTILFPSVGMHVWRDSVSERILSMLLCLYDRTGCLEDQKSLPWRLELKIRCVSMVIQLTVFLLPAYAYRSNKLHS